MRHFSRRMCYCSTKNVDQQQNNGGIAARLGNIIKVKANKSRFTKENSQVATRLFFDSRGLDEYYGLLELGEKHGIFIRKGNRILVGESSVYPSAILADPDKYFTEEVMQLLEEAANEEFSYGE